MQNSRHIVIIACFVVIAGCGGFNPLSDGSDTGDESKTTTQAIEETKSLTPTPTTSDTSSQDPLFDPDTDTDDIVLRLSDLPENYEYSGETNRRTTELSGEEQERYKSQGIVRQHSRSFRQAAESTGPVLVYSEATVYKSADDVDAQLEETRSTFESQSAEIKTIELASGVTATQISYENDQESRNILMYYKRANLLLLIISSGQKQSYSESTQELMIQMISDVR